MQKSIETRFFNFQRKKNKVSPEEASFLLENIKPNLKDWISKHPFELEIGCGKGSFLNKRAQKLPEHRFLGVDWSWKWMKIGVKHSIKKNIKNISYHKGEIFSFLKDQLPPNSIDICHIYFPDPWPKKKHHKRRFIKTDFLTCLHSRLKTKGIVYIATDFLKYYDNIQKVIYHTSSLHWKKVEHSNQRKLFIPHETNYEKKYKAEQRAFSFIELYKA